MCRPFLAPFAAAVLASTVAAAPSITVVREVRLPLPATAMDVRWASDQSVYVADFKAGLLEVDLGGRAQAKTLLAGGGLRSAGTGTIQSLFLPSYLGVSRDYIAVAAPLRQIAWRQRSATSFAQEVFANAFDIDVWKDHAVVYGVRGDAYGKWGGVGATLWLVSIAGDRLYFNGIAASPVEAVHKCAFPGIGVVRFFPDGRFVYVPGVEPGMQLFDANGKLMRRWDTAALGVDDHCRITEAQADVFGGSSELRAQWINQRQIVQEVIPLPEGPLVIIRRAMAGRVTWRGVLMSFSGDPVDVPIPITSPSPNAHLHADLKGDRLIFLVADLPTQKPITASPRLILAHLAR